MKICLCGKSILRWITQKEKSAFESIQITAKRLTTEKVLWLCHFKPDFGCLHLMLYRKCSDLNTARYLCTIIVRLKLRWKWLHWSWFSTFIDIYCGFIAFYTPWLMPARVLILGSFTFGNIFYSNLILKTNDTLKHSGVNGAKNHHISFRMRSWTSHIYIQRRRVCCGPRAINLHFLHFHTWFH